MIFVQVTKYPDALYAAQTARFMGGRMQCGAGGGRLAAD
jgi:hypothetical protein